MLDEEAVRFLQGGCALVVCTLAEDGLPYASRGWGLTILDPGAPVRGRLLVTPDVVAAGRIAVTATDVRTLRSLQLKGEVVGVEPMTGDDLAKSQQYTDAFYDDIVAVDRFPRDLLDRVRPVQFQACIIATDELFDQTPGPRAGIAVS